MNFSSLNHLIQRVRQTIPFCIVIALAFALKQYYSRTGADGLMWILAPTAWCVEQVTGIPFSFEHGTGFVNLDHRAVIAPACAGINFMIIVFCMIGFSLIGSEKNEKTRMFIIPAAFLSAFGLTIMVNALRIGLAVYSYDRNLHFGWFTQEKMHQIEGAAVYFAGLCCIYSVLTRMIRRIRFSGDILQARNTGVLAAKPCRLLVPTAWYLTMTLAVPLLLGKFSVYGRQFIEHGLFVLAIPAISNLCFWIKEQVSEKTMYGSSNPDYKPFLKTINRRNYGTF